MNRNNIWVHIGLAVVIITTAAVLGQIRRWQSKPFFNVQVEEVPVQKPQTKIRSISESQPEVMVRFRPGIKVSDIRKLAARSNDRLEDEIETVNGLVSIDDLDNADAETVAAQYRQMPDVLDRKSVV